MSITRLDSVSPILAEKFRCAPIAKRRKAVSLACELATSSVGLQTEEILTALEALRSGTRAPTSLRAEIERVAVTFDDQYLRLVEADEAPKPEALRLFSLARAASAVRFALDDDPAQLHDAIYEAIAAVDDSVELERLVGDTLQIDE